MFFPKKLYQLITVLINWEEAWGDFRVFRKFFLFDIFWLISLIIIQIIPYQKDGIV